MSIRRNFVLAGILASLFFGMSGLRSTPAYAYEWHRGHWLHDRHEGRLGWWWVVGPSWHYYPQPYVHPQTVIIEQTPAQAAPVIVEQQPPQPQIIVQQPAQPIVRPVIYYCKATGTNYPETMSCPGGWSTMTAETPPQQ